MSVSACETSGSRASRLGREPEARPGQRRELDEQMPERAGDDAEGEPGDAHARRQQERGADDREVVDDRGDRGRGEPAVRR